MNFVEHRKEAEGSDLHAFSNGFVSICSLACVIKVYRRRNILYVVCYSRFYTDFSNCIFLGYISLSLKNISVILCIS